MRKPSSRGSLEAVGLRPEPGCCGELNWRLDEPVAVGDVVELASRLAERGYRTKCCRPFLLVARAATGHEIAVVPATGRVQLRVDRLSTMPKRSTIARRLAADLLSACRESDPSGRTAGGVDRSPRSEDLSTPSL